MSLQGIGQQEYTSKVPWGYLDIYERLWKPIQDKPITLLEIGVYNGNSMRTWCRWFTTATIVGIDKNPDNPMNTDRAEIHFGLQDDIGFLESVANQYKGFDIIIDDGSHVWNDQKISFEFLWDYIKPGGMYIIEDLHTSYIRENAHEEYGNYEEETDTAKYLLEYADQVIEGISDIKGIEFYKSLAVIHK